jgi:hypothetical protein
MAIYSQNNKRTRTNPFLRPVFSLAIRSVKNAGSKLPSFPEQEMKRTNPLVRRFFAFDCQQL